MSYSKMTVEDFKKRLKNGDYKDATGARRGAGKADLSDAEKDQCRKAIDAHFGTKTPTSTTKASPQKKPKAESKKVAKAASGNGHAKSAKKTAAKPAGRKTRSSSTKDLAQASPDSESGYMVRLHLAKERVGTISQAVDTMQRAKLVHPQLDTAEAMTSAGSALHDIIKSVADDARSVIPNLEAGDADPAVIERLRATAPAAVGLPGEPSPIQQPAHQPQLS